MKQFYLRLACALAMTGSIAGCSSDDSKSTSPANAECPKGYTGYECSQQISPKKIIITKITVYSFPYLDNGIGWDSVIGTDASEADIYLSLSNSQGQPFNMGNSYFENASKQFAYDFVPPSPIVLNNPIEILSIDLYDYDGEDDTADHIGKTYFSVYSSTGGFPPIKQIENGDFIYQLSLEYVW